MVGEVLDVVGVGGGAVGLDGSGEFGVGDGCV